MTQFVKPYRIRFADCDIAGIVFHPQVFCMTNALTEDFFREKLDLPFETMDEAGFIFPIVHIECDFMKPMKVGDEILKVFEIERIGNSSLTVRIFFKKEDDVVFSCKETMVCMDLNTKRSIAINDDLRRRLEANL